MMGSTTLAQATSFDAGRCKRMTMPAMRRAGSRLLIALVLAMAAPLPSLARQRLDSGFSTSRFVYKAEGKRLSEVLVDFASSQGMPAIVDPKLEGVVSGNFDTTPRAFLDALTRSYSLIWYNDRTALYFYPARAVQTKVFRLKGYTTRQVKDFLSNLNIGDTRYPVRVDEGTSTLLVYGPPRHVELLSMAIESLDASVMDSNGMQTRVFPLRFASASDRNLGTVTIPGVASVLRALYGQGGKPASQAVSGGLSPRSRSAKTAVGSTEEPSAERKAQGLGLPGIFGGAMSSQPQDASAATTNNAAATGRDEGAQSTDRTDLPSSFQADEGINAVVIYGPGARMKEYEELIKRLDVKPTLIELEAMIIDVSTDTIDELGIDWAASGVSGRRSVSVSSPASITSTAAGNGVGVAPGSYTISTLVADAGRSLVTKIRALQGEGKARILSKPKVLGVANRPSTMSEKREVNVRVAGNLEARLYAIDVGTLLQVTPQITSATGESLPQIKLSLYIEDGTFEDNVVDQVPVVKRTEIRTEAHVREGESLLIGGITIESDSKQEAGVPGLSRIPGLGRLFRWDSKRSSKLERMFLITPRVVEEEPRYIEMPASDGDTRRQIAPPPVAAKASSPAASTPASTAAPASTSAQPLVPAAPSNQPGSAQRSAGEAGTEQVIDETVEGKKRHHRHHGRRHHGRSHPASETTDAVPAGMSATMSSPAQGKEGH